ncbi:MAG: DUF1080 domain-containing protein [Planctomycetota bacterium]|nr:DUF1080 domain-containing protein [Planctomycetota bacterium]
MSPLRVLLVLVLLAAAAATVFADMDTALDLVDEGDAALKAKNYAAAEKLYRQALEEEAGCLPARYGLGEALLGAEKTKAAVVAFRQVVREVRSSPGIPAAWKDYEAGALDRLEEHDDNGRELEKLIDAHVAKVLRIASKYRTKDPDLAQRALEVILTLRPEHKRANEMLGTMSRRGARKEAIFDGKQIADWDGGRGQWWKVVDGVIVGETKGLATYIRNQKEIRGNFDVVMEARIAKAYDESPFVALMAAWKAEYDHSRLGTLSGALRWFEYKGEDDKDRVFMRDASALKKPYDPSAWTVYELRYRKDFIHALVNGREVHKIERPKGREGGYVGILAQGCRAEIRRLDVLHRE